MIDSHVYPKKHYICTDNPQKTSSAYDSPPTDDGHHGDSQ